MALNELRTLTRSAVDTWDRTDEDIEERDFVPEGEPLATWWVQKTPGTTYWRAQVPAKHLPGQALHFRFSDAKVDDSGEAILPRLKGVGIWQFVGNATRALFMAHSQEYLGIPAFLEVDDNYLVPAPTFPGMRSDWGRRLDRSPTDQYSIQAHRKIVRWVDGVIVATPTLAEYYEKATQAPVYVCPNSVDPDDWPEVSKVAGQEGTTRTIGFAGSASHRYDLALVERALDWGWRNGGTIYKLGSAFAKWGFPYQQIEWTDDLAEYRRNLQVLDIGLCPLKRGDWHDCKSDIKAMEYLLSGAVPIVQKAPPYQDWFDVLPTAETEKDWLRQVKWALQAPEHELLEVWNRGYEFLLSRKLISQNIVKWREAIA